MTRTKTAKLPRREHVETMLSLIDIAQIEGQMGYWISIAPRSHVAMWRRWVFAYLSPLVRWDSNATAYRVVTTMPWKTREELTEVIKATGIGLHGTKARYIHNMTTLVRANPKLLQMPADNGFVDGENPWRSFRNALARSDDAPAVMMGGGKKTVSFAMEMCHPEDCRVIAVDRHVARWYGITDPDDQQYDAIESHWIETCDRFGLHPVMARHVIWDQHHGWRESTRYWSRVFENEIADEAIPVTA